MVATGPDGSGVAVLGPWVGLVTELLVVVPFGPWVVGAVSEVGVGLMTQPRAELMTGLQVLLPVGPASLVQMVIQMEWLLA